MSGLIKIYKYDKFDNDIFIYIYSNSLISELSNLNTNEIHFFRMHLLEDSVVVLSIDFFKTSRAFFKTTIFF